MCSSDLNAQINLIVIIMICMCIVMPSLFVNCPTVICSPSMLVFYYGETPLVNCGPRSILLHLKIQPTAIIVLFHSLQANIIFHTIRLILCFQQAGEIDTLTDSSGQSSLIVLCVASKSIVRISSSPTIQQVF